MFAKFNYFAGIVCLIFCLPLKIGAAQTHETEENISPLEVVSSLSGPSAGADFFNNRLLLDRGEDLELLDISDITSPTLLTRWRLPGKSVGVALYQDVAFVGLFGDDVRIFDISDPSRIPPEIGQLDYNYSSRNGGRLYRENNLIHLFSKHGSVLIHACYEISDPRQPRLFYREAGDFRYYGFNQIQDSIHYSLRPMKGQRGIVTYKIKHDDERTTLGQYVLQDDKAVWENVDFEVIGNRLYYVNGHRLWALDIDDPASPTLLCQYDILDESHAVNYAYMPVVNESFILFRAGIYTFNQELTSTLLVDLTDPEHPNTIQLPLQNISYANFLEPFLFIQESANPSLFIYQIKDISDPKLIEVIPDWKAWWPIHKVNEVIAIKKSSTALLLLDSSAENTGSPIGLIENINNVEWLDHINDILVIATDDELYFTEITGHP